VASIFCVFQVLCAIVVVATSSERFPL